MDKSFLLNSIQSVYIWFLSVSEFSRSEYILSVESLKRIYIFNSSIKYLFMLHLLIVFYSFLSAESLEHVVNLFLSESQEEVLKMGGFTPTPELYGKWGSEQQNYHPESTLVRILSKRELPKSVLQYSFSISTPAVRESAMKETPQATPYPYHWLCAPIPAAFFVLISSCRKEPKNHRVAIIR